MMQDTHQKANQKDADLDFRRWLSPLFLGSYAENDDLLEKIVVELLRDHMYWRRNVHPEDPPLISMLDQRSDEYLNFVADMKRELHGLSARLKNTAPFFNPRYIGHMASDLLLPGLIAQLVTTLYNANHVTDEAAPATLRLELDVGLQLANMFGYNTDERHQPCAWGHVTSGGTLANDESLWYFRAVRYWPQAAAAVLREAGLEPGPLRHCPLDLLAASDWQLFNLGIDRVIGLRRELLTLLRQRLSQDDARVLAARIESQRVEALGMAGFQQAHPGFNTPCVMVPDSAHYSWAKALKLLGFGSANLVNVAVTEHMRMDAAALDQALADAAAQQRPVLAVIGVLGTTEFGAIDPIDKLVTARRRWRERGLDFAIHIDAAWGGYLASMFRQPDGAMLSREQMLQDFRHFPSPQVYQAFAALRHADSITVDPHKLGFVPFGCGAYLARNRGMTDFISQRAAYVFDVEDDHTEVEYQRRFHNLGQYILEGSKPGAAAAAAWVTHKVLPLDHDHFGRLCAQTVRNGEYFFDHLQALRSALHGMARVIIPFEPDTNLVCLAINPEGNRSLAAMNRFGRALYEQMRVGTSVDMHTRAWFGSRTLVHRSALADAVATRLMQELGLDPASFSHEPRPGSDQADSIFLLRHTLMNPWLAVPTGGSNHLDRYCAYLAELVRQQLQRQ